MGIELKIKTDIKKKQGKNISSLMLMGIFPVAVAYCCQETRI